jgi:phosphatidate cytidylyltransferase
VLVLGFNATRLTGLFHSPSWRRYVGWVFIAPVFMLAVFSGGLVGSLFVGLLALLATREYWCMLGLPRFYRRLMVGNCAVSLVLGVARPDLVTMLPMIYFLVITCATMLRNRLRFELEHASLSLFGSVWIAFPLTHFLLFGELENGLVVLILIGFCVALADVFSFSAEQLFESPRLAELSKTPSRVRHNRTWAGTLGTLLGAVLGTLIFASLGSGLDTATLVLLGLAIGGGSVLGDLAESMIKRFVGQRGYTSGKRVGLGMLDRIDSLLVVIVVGYYFVQLVE